MNRTNTGLNVLEHMLSTNPNGSSIGETMGMSLAEVSTGEVILEVTPDERHLNPMGMVHGGFTATCIDGALALALYSTLAKDTAYATVDLNVKYLRPLKKSETYKTKGWLIDRTKQLAICEAEIRDASGTLFAKGTATLMVKKED